MTICNKSHRYNTAFINLPDDQGGEGRHKCCGCAYDQGYQSGLSRTEQVWVNLHVLPDSQAGTVRHKSPQAAFAEGYRDGMRDSYSYAG
ncbi:hypothetical protein LW347_15185 [Pectobacterium polonicum]|uniref:Uncharacterized protein n=1 Tax=Pectobacterium polonicum TaxID=2485124 RepID=A0AAE9T1P3_9GAMM|nr:MULTISPECIES: hypothetical protein [Pectobacterium]MCA6924833.1 hypothetical protein [Pectobacterium versatile]MCH5081597.1 hypothetical protein [Pectobacterium versatile]UVO07239.1 hypothetical protein LW347_15185 [Pectobacterium polonicum]